MDPVHFSGKEILDMAVRIEENGLRYYNTAGEAATDPELKELFEVLASEEEQHIVVFNDLKRLTDEEAWKEGYDPYAEEGAQYLRAIADTEVFTNPDRGAELARSVSDGKEALRVAIDMEKDSLLFYYELQRMVLEKDRDVVASLIEQEKDHVKRLTGLSKKLYGGA